MHVQKDIDMRTVCFVCDLSKHSLYKLYSNDSVWSLLAQQSLKVQTWAGGCFIHLLILSHDYFLGLARAQPSGSLPVISTCYYQCLFDVFNLLNFVTVWCLKGGRISEVATECLVPYMFKLGRAVCTLKTIRWGNRDLSNSAFTTSSFLMFYCWLWTSLPI